MANSVRFYVSNAGPPTTDGPGDFNERYGGSDTGSPGARWTLNVDVFSWPAGTDDQFLEFDFVVEDPDDPSVMWWGFIGCSIDLSTPIATSTVTGGFTFDSDSPPGWAAYWGVDKKYKVDYDGTFPDVLVYDGTYTPFATTATPFTIDGASAADWWLYATPPPPPPPDPPTITAPVDGSTVSYDADVVLVSLEWDPPVGGETVTSYQVRLNTGAPITASSPYDFSFPWRSTGTRTLSVRSVGAGGTSAWSSVTITLDPASVSTVDCFEDEALADTPDLLWLFREDDTQSWTADLSGNSHDGLVGAISHSGSSFPGASVSSTLDAYYLVRASGAITPPGSVTLLDSATDASGRHVAIYFHAAGSTHPLVSGFTGSGIAVEDFYVNPALDTTVDVSTGSDTGVASISVPAVSWPQYGLQLVAHSSPSISDDLSDDVSVMFNQTGYRWGWRNETTFPLTSSDPDYSDFPVRNSTDTFDFTLGTTDDDAWVSVVIGTSVTPHFGGTTNICDPDCADANGAAAAAWNIYDTEGIWPTPINDVIAISAWTAEFVGNVPEADELSGSPYPVLAFGQGIGSGVAAIFGQGGIGCWQHHIVVNDPSGPSGYKLRYYINGVLVSHNDSTSDLTFWPGIQGVGEASVAAVYPSALTRSRVDAHSSHFCELCRLSRGLVLGSLTLS